MERAYLDNILKIYFSGSGNEDLAIEIARGIDEELFLSLKEAHFKNFKFIDVHLNISYRELKFSNCTFENTVFTTDVSSFTFENCQFENCDFESDIEHGAPIFLACEIVKCNFSKISFQDDFLSDIDDFTNMDNLVEEYMSQFRDCNSVIYCSLGSIEKEIKGDEDYKKAIEIIEKYNILEEIGDSFFKNWKFKNIKKQELNIFCEDCVFEDCNLGGIDVYYDFCNCYFDNCDYYIKSYGPPESRYVVFLELDCTGWYIEKDTCLNFFYESIILKDAVFADDAELDLLIDASDLSGVNLDGKILPEFDFEEKIMEEVNFRSADLTDANFRNSSLCFADFTDANLQGADFRGADLRGAIFEGADLTDAIFDDAIISESMGNKKLNYFYSDRPRSVLFRKTNILRA